MAICPVVATAIPTATMYDNVFKKPQIISYKRGKSLKDMLVRAKL